MSDSALVLFSGGQDSTVCLTWALDRYERVETIGFDYGQRHIVELDCRKRILRIFKDSFPEWGSRLGLDHFLKLSALSQISETSLTREVEIKISNEGLPSTFVPGRNLLFFTYAAAVAYRRNIRTLVGGMCETDFSGYPDCRNETLQMLAKVIGLGTDETFTIETPLMWRNKAQTWAMANDLGGSELVDMITEETHSCYLGDRTRHNDWGFGCGACPACELRAEGFAAWKKMVPDPCH